MDGRDLIATVVICISFTITAISLAWIAWGPK